MTVRPATVHDVPVIVEMAEQFVRETSYAGHIALSVDRIAALAEGLIADTDGVVFVAEDRAGTVVGMIALKVFDHPMSGQRTASEFVWWVDPHHRGRAGVRLLRVAEAWARARGAQVLQMVAPNARVGEFYTAIGYVPIETSYARVL